MSIASSMFFTVKIGRTGPKISSCIRESFMSASTIVWFLKIFSNVSSLNTTHRWNKNIGPIVFTYLMNNLPFASFHHLHDPIKMTLINHSRIMNTFLWVRTVHFVDRFLQRFNQFWLSFRCGHYIIRCQTCLSTIKPFAFSNALSGFFNISIVLNNNGTKKCFYLLWNFWIKRIFLSTNHFPPNSSVTGVRYLAAACITIFPILGLPV